jgi:3D (Asp-Asp-Asp) domain-containing protein
MKITIMIISIIVLALVLFLLVDVTLTYKELYSQIEELEDKSEDYLNLCNFYINQVNEEIAKNEKLTDEFEVYRQDYVWQKFKVTGYTIDDYENQGTNNINALGWNLYDERFANLPSCAVDFNIVPQNSILKIDGLGVYIAADQGGLIFGYTENGLPKIDVLCPDKETALEITGIYDVRILEKGITIKD